MSDRLAKTASRLLGYSSLSSSWPYALPIAPPHLIIWMVIAFTSSSDSGSSNSGNSVAKITSWSRSAAFPAVATQEGRADTRSSSGIASWVSGTDGFAQGSIVVPHVDHRRCDARMVEGAPDQLKVAGPFEHQGCEAVPQGMRRSLPLDPGPFQPCREPSLHVSGTDPPALGQEYRPSSALTDPGLQGRPHLDRHHGPVGPTALCRAHVYLAVIQVQILDVQPDRRSNPQARAQEQGE